MMARKSKWPWEAARKRDSEEDDEYESRLDALFKAWVNDRISDLERAADERADLATDFARETSRSQRAAVTAELLLPSRRPKILAALAIKDADEKIEALSSAVRDTPSLRFMLGQIFRKRGGQKGRVVAMGQRQYTEDERELLRDMVADVSTIRLILKRHGVRKPRVSPEAIAAERAAGSREGWTPRAWGARRAKMLRDLRNRLKNE